MTDLITAYESKIKNEQVKIVKPVEIKTKYSPAPCLYDPVKDKEIVYNDDEIIYTNEKIIMQHSRTLWLVM